MEDRKWIVIDTNLLVRYLTDDDHAKAKAVDSLLSKAGKGEIRILVPSIVVAELVWVLESFYKMDPDGIAALVEAVLNTTGVEVTDKSIIKEALKLYKAKKIDMIDAWIIEFAKEAGIGTIYTFDKKHFKDAEGIERQKLLKICSKHDMRIYKEGKMNDLRNYIERRKKRDRKFAMDYEQGYRKFRASTLSRRIKTKIDGKFVEQINAFIAQYRKALRSSAKK